MMPSNVSTGRVAGRFIVGVQDGPDPDEDPDFIAAAGTIDFTASVPYLPNPTADPAPVTLLKTVIRGALDAEGYLCTSVVGPNGVMVAGVRGLRLVATDDPDLLVQNWTWTVTYRFTAVNGSTPSIPTHDIALPTYDPILNNVVDLTTAVKVPSSPGVGLPQAEAAVLRAEAAAGTVAEAVDLVAQAGEMVATTEAAKNTAVQAAAEATAPTDAMVAGKINTPGSATEIALSAAIGESLVPVMSDISLTLAGQTAMSEALPTRAAGSARTEVTPDGRRKIVLLTGQADQTYIVVNCTQAADTVRFVAGTRSTRFEITAAGTAQTIMDPVYPAPAADPYPIAPPSILKARIWIDDPSKITSIAFEMFGKTPGTGGLWTRSTAGTKLTPGWNTITHKISAGSTTDLVSLYRVAVHYTVTAATGVNMGELWLECPPKAQILFIEDRGYKTFVDFGLPDLRALGIPVTWALDPMLLSSNIGTVAEAITEAQVAQFYAEGDDMSIHSYAGEVTNTMTRDQIIADTLKSHKWLQDRGYTRGRQWRAAWTQDVAQQHAAAQPYYAAYATYISDAGAESWPPQDRFNMARYAIQGRTAAQIDAQFLTLERTHGLLLAYTHGVHDNGGNDITHAEWDYFISKVSAGISAGWLEGVTFSKLLERSGGVIR